MHSNRNGGDAGSLGEFCRVYECKSKTVKQGGSTVSKKQYCMKVIISLVSAFMIFFSGAMSVSAAATCAPIQLL